MADSKGGMRAADHLSEWKELAGKELRGKDVDELVWTSPDGIDVKALYTAADVEGLLIAGLTPKVNGAEIHQDKLGEYIRTGSTMNGRPAYCKNNKCAKCTPYTCHV